MDEASEIEVVEEGQSVVIEVPGQGHFMDRVMGGGMVEGDLHVNVTCGKFVNDVHAIGSGMKIVIRGSVEECEKWINENVRPDFSAADYEGAQEFTTRLFRKLHQRSTLSPGVVPAS